MVTIATIAERTKDVVIVLHGGVNSVIIANMARTSDHRSGDCLPLGLGAGWYTDEKRRWDKGVLDITTRFEILAHRGWLRGHYQDEVIGAQYSLLLAPLRSSRTASTLLARH